MILDAGRALLLQGAAGVLFGFVRFLALVSD